MNYKTIVQDELVSNQRCFLMGAELSHTENTSLIVYAEPDTSTTAANKVINLSVTAYKRHDKIMFPYPGIPVSGIFADWTAGVGTVYFRTEG